MDECDRNEELARLRATVDELRRELAKREEPERPSLAAILDATSDRILMVDRDARLVAFNQAFGRSHHALYGREAHVGGAPLDAVFEADRPVLVDAFHRAIAGERTVIERGPLYAGSQAQYTEWTFNPVVNGGEVVGVVGVNRDVTRRVLAEQRLRLSEARLSALMESTADAIWSVGPTLRLTAFNGVFARWCAAAEGPPVAIGERVVERVPPDRRAEVGAAYRRAMRGERVVLELGPLPDGTLHEITLHPIRSEGTVTGVAGVGRDRTEQLRAERAVRESQAMLSEIIGGTSTAIFSIDGAHRLTALNAQWARLCREAGGKSPAVGMPLFEALPEGLRELWRGLVDATLAGDRLSFEFAVSQQSGVRYLDVSLQPLVADGVVTGAAAFCFDVTTRKRAEEALRSSEARLLALMEGSADAMWTIDRGERLVSFNSAFERRARAYGLVPSSGGALFEQLALAPDDPLRAHLARAFRGERFRVMYRGWIHADEECELTFNPVLAPLSVAGVAVIAREREAKSSRVAHAPHRVSRRRGGRGRSHST